MTSSSVKRLRRPIALLLLSGGLAVAGFAFVRGPSRRATVLESEQIVVDGTVRNYRLVVPGGGGEERLPIVFHFHGHGNTPSSEADRTKLDQLAASQGFVLVYPEAINGCWRVRDTYSRSGPNDSDVRFFDCLLARLVARLDIDRRRVYLTGMSLGAVFVHELALARSRSVAAAVAHSGAAPGRIDCELPFPIMMVVGENEQLMLEAARRDLRRYRDKGHPGELLVAQGIGHAWARRHNMRMWRFLARHRLAD